ncbi:hypothetical protein [Anaerotruncus colihominis]|uniref:hypothetical protein n=1 Tax=Anaerotruncus colihominis TaxID=169435 RepID=UPI0026ED8D0E|nr:hypothetical protein [Anaerotruncus colihominis]
MRIDLHRFAMPDTEVCTAEDLYFRRDEEKVDYDFENERYVFQEKGTMEGNTYFNVFCASKWMQYTSVAKLGVSIQIKGSFDVALMRSTLIDGQPSHTTVIQRRFDSDEKMLCTLSHNFSYDQFPYLYYVRLTARADDSVFYGGGYFTDTEQLDPVRIGIVFCTFKREKYIYRNAALFDKYFFQNEHSPYQDQLRVFYVDNAGTLDPVNFDGKYQTVLKNRNVGGAGGFTRGMIEVMRRRDLFTHVLLMDDDAQIDPHSIERTCAFLSLLRPEHRDLFIGGATLRLDLQHVQLEAGAIWDNNVLINLKFNYDLSKEQDLLKNNIDESHNYNAWVYFCIPLMAISDQKLPMPLFVRGDDMEFGIRNSRKLLEMNGVCAWHAPVHNRYSFFMTYYVLRNQLILNALYDRKFNARGAVGVVFRNIARELLYYRYSNVELVFLAAEHFLRGIPFLRDTDAQQLHSEIMKYTPKMLDFNQLSQTEYPFSILKLQLTQARKDRRIKKLLRLITFNGYLLPRIFNRRGSLNNFAVVELYNCRPIEFYRTSSVLQVDMISEKGIVTKQNKACFIKTSFRFLGLAMRMLFGGYRKACRSFIEEQETVTNLSFWENYLNCKEDQKHEC